MSSKQDKRPGGIPMIPSVAFLGEGEMYLWGEPILLQKWAKGDSQREEGLSEVYQRFLKIATSLVRSGKIKRGAQVH